MRADTEVSRLSGALAVKRMNGVPTVFPRSTVEVSPPEDLLQTVYDHGPVPVCISCMAAAPACLAPAALSYSMQPNLLNAASKLWL